MVAHGTLVAVVDRRMSASDAKQTTAVGDQTRDRITLQMVQKPRAHHFLLSLAQRRLGCQTEFDHRLPSLLSTVHNK